LQGSLGALIFWLLDLPARFSWGCAMAVFAIGAGGRYRSLIWGPAALFLLR
jgi:hypothetical protein